MGIKTQKWVFPSREDCLRCHTAAGGYVLGVNARQLNRDHLFPETGKSENQIGTWNKLHLFDTNLNAETLAALPQLAAITNSSATLEKRVRSYLDVNCSHCHQPGGVRAFWDARYETPLDETGIINGPLSQSLDIPGAKVVVPHQLEKSILYQRLNSVGPIQMPPLGKTLIDNDAALAVAAWIENLDRRDSEVPDVFSSLDIGFANLPGTTDRLNGQLFVKTGSGDIWLNEDSCRFVYTQLHGDGEIIARLVSTSTAVAKTGLMIRDNLLPGSPNAAITFISGFGSAIQWRSQNEGESDYLPGPLLEPPFWLRLRRSGNLLIGSASMNGSDWLPVGTKELALDADAYIGMVAAARSPGASSTCVYDGIQTSGGISNIPPFVRIESSSQNSSSSLGIGIKFLATASDFDGTIEKVLFMDGNSILAETTTPPFEFTLEESNSGEYTIYARAIDNRGTASDSNAVTFSTDETGQSSAPIITVNASDLDIPIGGTFSASAMVEGVTPEEFQWLFNGFAIPGATQDSYSISKVTPDDAGEYSLSITYFGGTSVSEPLNLTVIPAAPTAPSISASPGDLSTSIKELVTLTVTANGTEPLYYQWQRNGANLPNANAATLQIQNCQFSDAGIYTVVVTNAQGAAVSEPFTLSVTDIHVYAGTTIAGPIGARYRIDTIDALLNLKWTELETIELLETPTIYFDRQSPNHPTRFYRAVRVK
jgi:hypothetical protein